MYSMAQKGYCPRIFARTNRHGVPYYAVFVSWLVGLLAFLGAGSGSGNVCELKKFLRGIRRHSMNLIADTFYCSLSTYFNPLFSLIPNPHSQLPSQPYRSLWNLDLVGHRHHSHALQSWNESSRLVSRHVTLEILFSSSWKLLDFLHGLNHYHLLRMDCFP